METDDVSKATDRPKGLPWWAAILLPLVATAAGAAADEQFNHGLGIPFQVTFAAGCLISVLFVRRRNLFGPMVQPPLIMAFAASPVVLYYSDKGLSGNLVSQVITVGTPLVDNFMVQAAVTVGTLVIGMLRLIITRKRVPAAATA
jgi:Domain of unknown function (DUF6542)